MTYGAMDYQQIADELGRQEGRKFTKQQIWRIEQKALKKIREFLREHPFYATELYSLLDDNKSFTPRGAFRELSSLNLWRMAQDGSETEQELPLDS